MTGRGPGTLVALAVAAALGCGDPWEAPAPPAPGSGLAIDPLSLTLVVGDSGSIGFTVEQGTRITITSSAPAIAEPSTPDPTATRAVYVRGKAAGTATLTVTFVGRQTSVASVPVTVNPRPTAPLAITVSPTVRTMGVGDTARFVATVIRSSAAQDDRATFASTDTSVLTVDSTGLATARRVGTAAIRVAPRAHPAAAAVATVVVVPAGHADARIRISPSTAVTLEPNASLLLAASLVRGDSVLTRDPRAFTFSSSDSCVAFVSADGRLFGGRNGQASVTVSSRDVPSERATVSATVRGPLALRATIQSIVTGTPPRPVDPESVRGTVSVIANVDATLLPGRAELRLDGRLVESREVARDTVVSRLAFVVDTDARDPATGARLFPNGSRTLALSVTTRRVAAVAGCPEWLDADTVALQLTLANPGVGAARWP